MQSAIDLSSRLGRVREYLSRDPDNLNLLAESADLSLALGRLSDARAAVERGLAGSPGNPFFRSRLSSIALAEQKWDEAIELCRGLLAEGHDDPAIRYNLGRGLLFSGQYEGAKDQFEGLLGREGVQGPRLKGARLEYFRLEYFRSD